jgi:hypothetical protein
LREKEFAKARRFAKGREEEPLKCDTANAETTEATEIAEITEKIFLRAFSVTFVVFPTNGGHSVIISSGSPRTLRG